MIGFIQSTSTMTWARGSRVGEGRHKPGNLSAMVALQAEERGLRTQVAELQEAGRKLAHATAAAGARAAKLRRTDSGGVSP